MATPERPAAGKLRTAKGARDIGPEQMAIREKVIAIATAVFERHGAVALDTPVFELKETLVGTYGEDSKLIYDLADQGGESLSLRYDLTVPFARYLTMHHVAQMKRYHIAKVYRRDQPQIGRGRYREFQQCDFDIAGTHDPMVPDAEVLKVLIDILDELGVGEYEIKLSHRKLLEAMLDVCGVPAVEFRAVCSAIDKLDKGTWFDVYTELLDKGMSIATAERIGSYVNVRGPPRQFRKLLADDELGRHALAQEALAELDTLSDYLQAMGALHRITLDLSLARGLDYYTGLVYEAILVDANTTKVGSIAAGGRYDRLIGRFGWKNVPAVGVSLGIERIFDVLQARMHDAKATVRSRKTEVLVASIGPEMMVKRMQTCARLWAGGIKAEFMYKVAPKISKQLEYALHEGIPLVVLFGSDEVAAGTVAIRDLRSNEQSNVDAASLLDEVRARLHSVCPSRP